ncbi:MAG: YraN family protein [Syntrophobacteraceae bacterium CG07_land_8_20_14_0_80_61_8]|nr:MAG: YraN family protein [Syntrophobacteraceae bacterium CG07_land_8_20_14_0_80_61_8]
MSQDWNRTEKGRRAEALAADFLSDRGLKLVTANYRCALGEIDLICRDGATYVFVEVRSRSGSSHGSAQESVTRRKQQRLVRLAQWYLKEVRQPRASARFDVVAVQWRGGEADLAWIANAFGADS